MRPGARRLSWISVAVLLLGLVRLTMHLSRWWMA